MRRLAVLLLLLAISISCESLREITNPSGVQTQTDGTGSGTVEYKVTGTTTTRASMTYATGSGGTGQFNNAVLPWSTSSYGFVTGQFVYLSAQNGSDAGCVRVEIVTRGKSYKIEQACGAYAIATASGTY